jgi:wobble nucleotide-excising tRNase
MIKKIIKIQNTGSFSNFTLDQGLLFDKLNLFYGENGSGKSTFSTIIKSLSTNNPYLISNKTTILDGKELGSSSCELKLNDFTYKFENSQWISCNTNSNYQPKNILVFDDEYIEKNIFTFLESNINHARNQYKIIFGEAGVELNKNKEGLVNKNKNILKPALDTAKNNFFLKYKLTVEDYKKYNFSKTEELLSEEIDKIKKQIQASQINLSNKNIEFKLLEQFNLVSDDEVSKLNQILSTNIKSAAHLKAKKEVEEFKQQYFHQGTSHDNFLKYGIANVNKEGKKICPLCHNEFEEDLFDLYRNYFDRGYDELVANLEVIKLKFVEVSVNDLLFKNTENLKFYNFWKKYIKDLNEPKIEIDDIVGQYNQSIKDIQTKISLKKEQTSKTDFKVENLNKIASEIKNIIQTYNENLNKSITKIQNYQKSISTINLTKVQQDKTQLENELQLLNQKKSIISDIISIDEKAKEIKEYKSNIKNLDEKIDTELSKITESFIQKINKYLENENFKVNKIDLPNHKNFSELHCEINLEFNKKPVKIYSKNKSDRLNDFLSTGEKRSLGFAFFMASLENENQLENKVLIFDDPITSLDYNRKSKVARKLISISQNVSQVFILTHDRHFFYHSFTESKRLKADPNYYLVKKIGNSSNIKIVQEQDIKHLIDKNHHHNFWKLQQYSLSLVNLNEPANSLRKLFEDLLEYKFPETCKKIRNKNYKTLFTANSLQIFVNDSCFNQDIFKIIKGDNGDESILDFVNDESHTSPAEFTDQEKRDYVKKGLEIFKKI